MMISTQRAIRILLAILPGLMVLNGCSVRRFAINNLADAVSHTGTTFASDDDPELIRDAAPFSLKLMESLLAETPDHRDLLTATSSGFTQYAYAFVQEDADEMEAKDLAAAQAMRNRARKLFLRARDYGLRGLEVAHAGMTKQLRENPKQAVAATTKDDVALLYWTAAAWGSAITLAKDDPHLIADQPIVESLIDRALELDESFQAGAIHNFLISYEPARRGIAGDPNARCREHFRRAVELSSGQSAAPYLALAEAVCIQAQNRKEFESLLKQALAVDVDARPEWRLANLIMQQRARWLLSRTDELFVE